MNYGREMGQMSSIDQYLQIRINAEQSVNQIPQEYSLLKINNKGRPTKKIKLNVEQKYENKDNQTMDKQKESIHQILLLFLDFYAKIQIPKGFIFSRRERSKFMLDQEKNLYSVKIIWNGEHKWDYIEEKKKLLNTAQSYRNFFVLSELEQAVNFLLQVSAHIASQFTLQVYRIMLEILKISRLKKKHHQRSIMLNRYNSQSFQLREKLDTLASTIREDKHNNYYIFSYKFFKEREPSLKKNKKPDIDIYKTLVNGLYEHLQYLIA